MDDKLMFAAVLLGGYVLGRTKRMKLALTVAGALAVRELRSNPDLLKAGSSVLSSPAVKKLTDEFSGRLVEAGKTAAVAAATKRVDGLVSNLEKRAGARQAEHGPEEDEPADAPEESPEPTEESADEETEEPSDEEETAQEDEEEEPAAKRSKRGSSSSGGARSSRSSAQSGSKQGSAGTRARKPSGGSSARRSGSR
jgi:outer membrane biosynthesis protein TonB